MDAIRETKKHFLIKEPFNPTGAGAISYLTELNNKQTEIKLEIQHSAALLKRSWRYDYIAMKLKKKMELIS